MSGSDFDYDANRKNNWRKWLWNQIADRVFPRHDATVLYLAGREDWDAKEAIKRGFSNDNLIAVDRDESVVRALRKKGRLAIQGDIFDILDTWPADRRIKVVLLDLCGGAQYKVINNSLLWHPALATATIAANLLAGRESDEEAQKIIDAFIEETGRCHRGELFSRSYIVRLKALIMWHSEESKDKTIGELLFDLLWKESRAVLNSYKSIIVNKKGHRSVQRFDSVVFSNPIDLFLRTRDGNDFRPYWEKHYDQWLRPQKKISRRIAATLAHQTMRLYGR